MSITQNEAVEILRKKGYTDAADLLAELPIATTTTEPPPFGPPERVLTVAELDALTVDEHMRLDREQPGLIERSLAALGS